MPLLMLRRKYAAPVILLTFAAGFCARAEVLYETESRYQNIRVTQNGSVRTLAFRRSGTDYRESAVDRKDPLRLVLDYTRLMFAGFLFVPEPTDVLMVGLGAGVCPRVMSHYVPEARFDVIELDPAVRRVATTYFDFRETQRIRVMVRDGRVGAKILAHRQRRYDIIMLDAFRAGYIPYHLTTKEFLQECRQLLKPGGVLLSNLWPSLLLYQYERRTMRQVFGEQYGFGLSGNRIVVCLPQPLNLAADELRRRAREFTRQRKLGFDLATVVADMERDPGYAPIGPILTDDYAPANVLNSMPRD